MLEDRDLERVPVVEDGRLVGVLSRAVVQRRLAEDEPPAVEPVARVLAAGVRAPAAASPSAGTESSAAASATPSSRSRSLTSIASRA